MAVVAVAPAEGDRGAPVGSGGFGGEEAFEAFEQALGAGRNWFRSVIGAVFRVVFFGLQGEGDDEQHGDKAEFEADEPHGASFAGPARRAGGYTRAGNDCQPRKFPSMFHPLPIRPAFLLPVPPFCHLRRAAAGGLRRRAASGERPVGTGGSAVCTSVVAGRYGARAHRWRASAPAARASAAAGGWADLPGWSGDAIDEAWPAFWRRAGPSAGRRCGPPVARRPAAGRAPGASAVRNFFESRFTPWRVSNPDGTRKALITGYYEPSSTAAATRAEPTTGRCWVCRTTCCPSIWATCCPTSGPGLRGRLVGKKVVPYYSRAEVARMADKFAARAILYADDAVDLFFLQVQGSGRVKLPTAASCASPTPTPTAIPTSPSAAGWPTRANCASIKPRWTASRTGRRPTPAACRRCSTPT